jgi:hypothetical protein
MAGTRIHVPRVDAEFDDKRGTRYKLLRFDVVGSGTDKLELGEVPSSVTILEGPSNYSSSNFYLTAPFTSSVDAVTDEDARRVGIKNLMRNPNGEYKVLVSFTGQKS